MVLESDDDGAIKADNAECWSNESSDEEETSNSAQPNLHERDVSNFLKLAEALTLYLSEELTEADVEMADKLLRQYCTELLEVCRRYHIVGIIFCLTFSPDLWFVRYPSKPPLCDAHRRVHPQLWSITRVLDLRI